MQLFFIIVVITCDKVDIEHMSFSPPTSDTHDYNTTIIYSCDVGYNHSYGDLTHRCTETRQWTGTFPNCTSNYLFTYEQRHDKINYVADPYEKTQISFSISSALSESLLSA